jgi:proteasome accessory factor C
MSDLHQRLRTLLFLVPYVYRNRGVSLDELASRLGVEERQLYKEFDFLMLIGRPPFSPDDLVDIHVDRGRVYVELPSSLDRPPRFSMLEALALASAAQLFTGAEQMGEAATAVRVALNKVLASLPKDTRAICEQLAERYLVLSSTGASPHLDLLRRAVEERLEVEMTYYSAGRDEVGDRVVRPYGLVHRAGVWYLLAWCTERQAIRVFRVSRVQTAQLSDRIFDPATDFDPATFLDSQLNVPWQGAREVVLRFTSEDARWVEERWRPEYLEPLADGGLRVRMYDVSDSYVLSYVASFAGRAVIESPTELAARLAQDAGAALEKYK